MPEADPGGPLHRRSWSRSSRAAAGRLRVGDASRPHQAAGLLGEQPVAAGSAGSISATARSSRSAATSGRSRRGFPGGPGQPRDGLGVSAPGAAGEVLGDLQGRGTRLRQPLPGLAVQPAAHAARQVLIDAVADQVVAKPQDGAVVFEDARRDRLRQRQRQLEGGRGR